MAGSRIKGITIEIDGNTTKLQKSLKEVDSSLKTTQSSLKDINRLLKLDPSNTTLLKQKQEELSKAIVDTKSRLTTLKEALKQSTDPEQQKKLQREIIATENELKNLEKEAKQCASVMGTQFQNAGKKLQELGKKTSEVGMNMSKNITAPIVALGGVAVKTTADFDKSMSKVEAVSGATTDEMEILRAKAREMGATTKFSAQESADAFTYMAMAGWDAGQMVDGISGIMSLAAADGLDLATTSDIVTDALTAFGLKAEDSGHFADILAAASSSANTNVSMLGESFKYVAPVAGAMSYSAEDVAVALGLMANAGIKGSSAGTALRNVLTRMAKPTDEVLDAMDGLGLSLTDAEGNMVPMIDLLRDMRQGFSELKEGDDFLDTIIAWNAELEAGNVTQEEYDQHMQDTIATMDDATLATKAQYAVMLAGKQGLAGLMAIVNASDDDFNSLTESIYGSSEAFDGMGQAQGMAETMLNNLDGQIIKLKSALSELAIQFGEILMPYIQAFVEKIQLLVEWFTNLDEGTKKTILMIAGIIAVIGPVLVIVGKLAMAIGTVVKVVGTIMTVLAGLNPIVLAIVAVVGVLTVLIVKNWDKIKAKTMDLIKNLKKLFGDIKTFIINTVNNIKTTVSNVLNNIKTLVTTAFNNIKSTVTTVMNNIKTTISTIFNGIKTAISSSIEGIKTVVKNGFDAMKNSIQTILNSAKSIASGIIDGIKALFNLSGTSWTLPDISGVLNGIKNVASGIIEGIKGLFNLSGASWTLPSISGVFEGIKSTVSSAISTIKGMFNLGDASWSLPKIKLPHFKVTGGFGWSWDGGVTLPKISVDWYKKAYDNALMFTKPTVLATANGYKGFGDGAGAEIVIGQNKLMDMMSKASGSSVVVNMTVNGAPGQSVNKLADIVIDKLTTKIERESRW